VFPIPVDFAGANGCNSAAVRISSNELGFGVGLAARFIVGSGALDRPFVLLDVGARGGIHQRWLAFDPSLEVYGFDAAAEDSPPNPRHHYFRLAVGNFDGECTFHVPDNPYEGRVSSDGKHQVSMARLDTLWAKGSLPAADFIKIDCEGYELEVLAGAAEYLKAIDLLGADIESHFHVRPGLPYSHFAAVNTVLIERGLRMADLALSRALDAEQPWNGTCNVLFSRHLLDEPGSKPKCSAILKMIAVFDVYGLAGPAVALARGFRDVISERIDVDALCRKLTLSPRVAALEQYLPHLGLGFWTRAKSRLAR
jgi:FkbM family methyltransferase